MSYVSASATLLDADFPLSALASKSSGSSQLLLNVRFPYLSLDPLTVLLDSGCSHSFISNSLISDLALPLDPLKRSLTLRLFDGSVAPCGPITHKIAAEFKLPYMDPESWTFLATDLDPSCDVVLGLDWLRSQIHK